MFVDKAMTLFFGFVLFQKQHRGDPVEAAKLGDALSQPIADIVDMVAANTFSSNVDPMGEAIGALKEAGNEIGKGLHQLKQAYVGLEIKAAQLRYSNYILRRRHAFMLGECF
jgi:hypothetical protein